MFRIPEVKIQGKGKWRVVPLTYPLSLHLVQLLLGEVAGSAHKLCPDPQHEYPTDSPDREADKPVDAIQIQ